MKRVLNLKQGRVRRYALIVLLGVASMWLLWLAFLNRLSVAPSIRPAGATGDAVPPALPMTYSELLAVEPSRLGDCDIALMNLLCAEGLPNAEGLDVQSALALLDKWATRVRTETQRHYYRFQKNPAEYEHSEGYFRMLMMAVVLYEDFQVRYNPERIASPGQAALDDGFFADSQDVFLHGLLGPRRMGTCSSMPVLYVALGRRLGYPLKLVTTKGHLFVRWESPVERFNVDATAKGMNRYGDDYYRNWPFPLTEAEINEHGYLKSLSAAEELAVFLSIRGQCLVEAGRYAEAINSYQHAIRLRPASRDQRLLLAQAQAKGEHALEPLAPVSTAVGLGRIPSLLEASHDIASELVPNPHPLRQIR